MHVGAPSDCNKAAENRELLKLIIHQSWCGKTDKYLCSHWKFCKWTLQVKRWCVSVCHHSKLCPAVRIESRFQFRALVRTAHRRQPCAPICPPLHLTFTVSGWLTEAYESFWWMSEHPSSRMSHFLGFWSCLECQDKNLPSTLFSSTSNNVYFSFFSYTVQDHSCSMLDTDQMEPLLHTLSSFPLYFCPCPRTLQMRTKCCNTTGNCGGSVEHYSH